MSYLQCLEVEPDSEPDAAVIWLHGLGANGHDFEPAVPHMIMPGGPAIRFIFPHAPSIPVTINGGYVMPAWFDILDADFDLNVDLQGIRTSADAVKALIAREIGRGIDSRRIVLAGFSQGGTVCYETALTYSLPLAGLLALSTYFATHGSMVPELANRKLPVRIYHGSYDPVVPEFLGRQGYEILREMRYDVRYRTYPMEHSVCPEELSDIARVLHRWLD